MTGAQCIIGTQKNPNSAILSYDDDDYSQQYGQIKDGFKPLTKDHILQQYISDKVF